jgi:hypothetical protein
MFRKSILVALVLLAGLAQDSAAANGFLTLRIDGRILRKASGKLVTTLSAFEIDGQDAITLENRKSKEQKTVKLSSIYEDSSYTEALPPAEYEAFEPDAWIAYVNWSIPPNTDALNKRLTAIHEEQNLLRHAMGNALMEDDAGGGKVTSRSTLNKIEKYHRLGQRIAQEIMRNWNREETNPFFLPVRIQVGYNPFGPKQAGNTFQTPLVQAREVLYWELNRLLTQQYGIDEVLVPLVYNAPGTTREINPMGEMSLDQQLEFSPQLHMSSETLDGAVYLLRQDFVVDLRNALRTRDYLGSFVTDRPVLDAFVNEGKVTAVAGDRLAVTFIPPFTVPGDRMFVVPEGATNPSDEIPIVIETPKELEGYSLTAPLAPEQLARVKQGMKVRRRK